MIFSSSIPHYRIFVVVVHELMAIFHCEVRQRLRAKRGKANWMEGTALLRLARNDIFLLTMVVSGKRDMCLGNEIL